MRRALLIISIAVLLIGGSLAAYFYFANKSMVAVTPNNPGASFPTAGNQTFSTTTIPSNPLATQTPVSVSSRLVQISPGPIVPGEAVTDIPAINASSTPETTVTYIEKQSGNVYSYLTSSKTLTRINNKTIPGIQSASWLPHASAAFVQYLSGNDFSTINTYALSATSSTGFFLPQNLSSVVASGSGVLTLSSGVNGSIVSLVNADGSHSSQVFTTPLSALRISFAGKNQYLAFSKPSASLSGDAFLVDSKGYFSRIAGPENGLTALASHSGRWILVSFIKNSVMQMELIDTTTGGALPLPVATIADKCVWTTDDTALYCGIPVHPEVSLQYPDDWYQGVAHFSDRIWKIDVAGRYARLILDFPAVNTKETLDATALAINPLQTVLVFVNKNDGSLWSYSL